MEKYKFDTLVEGSKRRARAITLREDDRESAEQDFKFTTAEEFIKRQSAIYYIRI